MGRRERGALESLVLRVLWHAEADLSAREVRESFDEAERPALTTVLTVLDRLATKGLVRRTAAGNGSRFGPRRSESEEIAAAMARTLDGSEDREGALLRFAGQLDADDVAALGRALDERA